LPAGPSGILFSKQSFKSVIKFANFILAYVGLSQFVRDTQKIWSGEIWFI
jgi:hypothetical protein